MLGLTVSLLQATPAAGEQTADETTARPPLTCSETRYPADSRRPSDIVAVDLDGDGHLDLATANGGSDDVSVLLDDGSGDYTIAESSPHSVGPAPAGLVTGDFNGDGHPDLATANTGVASRDDVSVLINAGDGTFEDAVHFPAAVDEEATPQDLDRKSVV